MRGLTLRIVVPLLLFSAVSWPQATKSARTPAAADGKTVKTLHLSPVDSVIAKSEVASSFVQPLFCDDDGNLYLSSDERAAAIRKLSSKGERVALFQPTANPDVKVSNTGYFSVTPEGDVYTIVFARDDMSRYVLAFKPDGTYREKIKLSPGFPWIPATITVFPNGTFLATGQEYVREPGKPMLPLTAIFAADGSMLKEVTLEDDEKINALAADHDSRVTAATNPLSNRAVSWGQAATAADGNVYVMRWLSPAVFYAVSPGGEVIRRFEVDSGDSNFRPIAMHISGKRIAVLFYHPQTMEKVMKIVDLEGHEIAAYDEVRENGKPKLGVLGLAFACYTSKPERFTFLLAGEDHRIEMKFVEAR